MCRAAGFAWMLLAVRGSILARYISTPSALAWSIIGSGIEHQQVQNADAVLDGRIDSEVLQDKKGVDWTQGREGIGHGRHRVDVVLRSVDQVTR